MINEAVIWYAAFVGWPAVPDINAERQSDAVACGVISAELHEPPVPQVDVGGAAATVTVTDFGELVPPAPVQVSVYVFVAVSAPVLLLPAAAGVAAPSIVMLHEVAFVVTHESVELAL